MSGISWINEVLRDKTIRFLAVAVLVLLLFILMFELYRLYSGGSTLINKITGENAEFVSGETPYGSSWEDYDGNFKIFVKFAKEFNKPPIVLSSLTGDDSHWLVLGGSSPYTVTTEGFTIYLSGHALNHSNIQSLAREHNWKINWVAIERN